MNMLPSDFVFPESPSNPRPTKGHIKLLNYLDALGDGEVFNKEVSSIRSRFNIPIGESFEEIDKWKKGLTKNDNKNFRNAVRRLGLKYGFDPHLEGFSWLYDLIIFNDGDYSKAIKHKVDICVAGINRDRKLCNMYPVALYISPYAKKSDIIDFLNKGYVEQIQPLQKEYEDSKVMIGRFKSRKQPKNVARNRAVYDFYKLPKTIKAKIGFSEYIFSQTGIKAEREKGLDIGSIGKIRSLETKRRKDL